MKKLFLFLIAVLSVAAVSAQETDYSVFADKFNFIVCNDLGRNGYYDQKPIAELMGQMSEDGVDPEFVAALGDIHHFNGVQSVTDPLWMTNYELIYSHPELMLDWFPILGNHEYRGNTQACIDYSQVSRRWEMPARYYTKVYRDGDMAIRLVWIDTTPMMNKYRSQPDEYPDASCQDWQRQLTWLDSVLTAEREDWVVVMGHHPIFADTGKDVSERQDMQQTVNPVLKRHDVDFYINGHIHNFQHIRRKDSRIDYVTNSSASLSRTNVNPVEGTVFCSGAPGFSVVSATKDTLALRMINRQGRVIHEVIRTKK
ncbi:MAG: metallophosphoesterase [Prevotella sp.]|nr:metallophosphoesterase [Prevotella sp.]